MQTLVSSLMIVCLGGATAPYSLTIDFEAPTYLGGTAVWDVGPYVPLENQDGWYRAAGTDPNGALVVVGDNGPALPGNQCVEFTNWADGVRMRKIMADAVALGGPEFTFQYDVKDMFNRITPWGETPAENWSTTTFRARVYDSAAGYAPIGSWHYDGGGGPACNPFVGKEPDGDPGDWGIGDPAWLDRDWHTVAWHWNYDTNVFSKVTFDGVDYPRTNEWFYDWNGQGTAGGVAEVADLLSYWLTADTTPDYWKLDNIIVSATPEPASLALLALGGLALLRRR